MSTPTPQQRIDEIQADYQQWLALQKKLKQAEKDWKKSIKLMENMQTFYFEGEFQHYYQQIEQGLDVNLATDGEYSVMSEDTIWNAMHEQDQALWRMLRFAVKQLDND